MLKQLWFNFVENNQGGVFAKSTFILRHSTQQLNRFSCGCSFYHIVACLNKTMNYSLMTDSWIFDIDAP